MSLNLKPNEVCTYSQSCPYSNSTNSYCMGTDKNRNTPFHCDYVSNEGVFLENKFRSKEDLSGKMKVLHE